MIDQLIVKSLELAPVVTNGHGLGVPLKRPRRLDNNKVIDIVVERVESNFEKVELGVYHEEIIYLAFPRGGLWLKDCVAVSSTELLRWFRLVVFVVGLIWEEFYSGQVGKTEVCVCDSVCRLGW